MRDVTDEMTEGTDVTAGAADEAAAARTGATDEQARERLLANPYVERFENGRITYSRNFHVEMYRRIHDQRMTYVQAYEDLGFDVGFLGTNRANNAGKRTMEMYRSNRLFAPDPGDWDGTVPMAEMGDLAPEQELAYLRARNRYLEAVVQAQKKLPSASAATPSYSSPATSASTPSSSRTR